MSKIYNGEPNLALARNIITSFIVSVKKNPEYLYKQTNSTSVGCLRNWRVAECMLAIDALEKSL